MDKIIGFIGGGNMASAMIGGILGAKLVEANQIVASCKTIDTKTRLEEKFGIKVYLDNAEVTKQADILVLAIKPGMFVTVLPEIVNVEKDGQIIVSIAAGKSIASIEKAYGRPIKLVRVMPNTPALVGEAMSGLSGNANVTAEEMELVKEIFESFGKAEIVPESLMDTVTGVSGSSPAYVYMFIEAMADAAVADGMPRRQAYTFAAQSVLGAAKMVLETGEHPGVLKDAVCSPGGTTIEAVAVLEEKGLREAVIAGQRACVKKSKEMK